MEWKEIRLAYRDTATEPGLVHHRLASVQRRGDMMRVKITDIDTDDASRQYRSGGNLNNLLVHAVKEERARVKPDDLMIDAIRDAIYAAQDAEMEASDAE